MKDGASVATFFFAAFWALAMSGAGRYKAFDTATIWAGQNSSRAIGRMWYATITLMALPIFLVTVLLKWVVVDGGTTTMVVIGAVGSASVFGCVRILHAFIATDNRWQQYYDSKDQVTLARSEGEFCQPQTFDAHFGPGAIYIIGCLGAAKLIAYLSTHGCW